MSPASALNTKGVNLLSPIVFASVLFGAMVPYWLASPNTRSPTHLRFTDPYLSVGYDTAKFVYRKAAPTRPLETVHLFGRFSALTMRSVGEAAHAMVKEVARQFADIPVRFGMMI
jgi:Na+/H+-translocating membrane pyrophosphatase